MPVRRSRLPPPALIALLLTAAVIICFALPTAPPPPPPTVCCAVATAVPLSRARCSPIRAHASCWRVSLRRNSFTWTPLHSDALIALRGGADLLTTSVRRCCALGSCIPAAVPCARPLRSAVSRSFASASEEEDPSDALWFRAYDEGAELVVLARAGLLALILFLAAVIVEGAAFQPRRSGLAHSALGGLLLIGLSALLQLLLVPRAWQMPLWGAGPLRTTLCILAVILGAAALPACVLALQTVAVLYWHYVALIVQVLFWVLVGLVHFLYAVVVFYTRNLWIQLRVLYAGDGADEDSAQDVYIAQLNVSYNFVSAVGANALLRRVAASANNTAKRVLESANGAAYNQDHTSVDGDSARDSNDGSLSSDDVSRASLQRSPRLNEHTPLLNRALGDDGELVRTGTV